MKYRTLFLAAALTLSACGPAGDTAEPVRTPYADLIVAGTRLVVPGPAGWERREAEDQVVVFAAPGAAPDFLVSVDVMVIEPFPGDGRSLAELAEGRNEAGWRVVTVDEDAVISAYDVRGYSVRREIRRYSVSGEEIVVELRALRSRFSGLAGPVWHAAEGIRAS